MTCDDGSPAQPGFLGRCLDVLVQQGDVSEYADIIMKARQFQFRGWTMAVDECWKASR